jgi:hypothetical protein
VTALSSTPGSTVALCLGPYGGPRGVGVSYGRGTPVSLLHHGWAVASSSGHVIDFISDLPGAWSQHGSNLSI